MRRDPRHFLALLLFAGLTQVWMSPVLSNLGAVVAGTGAGDNFTFVWNGWWMREALATHVSPFHTPMLFAPWGVDLTLNTHTALPAAVAALMSTRMSILAATNYVLALHLYLNFVTAYELARRLTHHIGAGVVAGLIFGWSPYIGAHLAGHFNLVAIWVLPLVTLLLLDTLDSSRLWPALALGLALAATTYVEYYYAVYVVALIATIVLARATEVEWLNTPQHPWQRTVLRALGAVSVILLLGLIVIATTGGTVLSAGGMRISLRGTQNFVSGLGLIALVASLVRWLPSLRVRVNLQALGADAVRLLVPAVVAAVVIMQLVVALFRIWAQGDYVTQTYFWRSAPKGIDISTLLLGNPSGLAWGRIPERAYAAMGVDLVEQIAWLGPGVLTLAFIALRLGRTHPALRIWKALTLVFGVWALGPILLGFGRSLDILLPATLVRFIPLINNARIPARAMVGVYLAVAMLGAYAVVFLTERRRRTLAGLLALLVVVDYLPAPVRVFRVDRPAVYEVLRQQRGPGSVCELPLGVRDGLGERGRSDTSTLFYQSIHGRPITGGAVSRLPRRTWDAYENDPVLGPLLRLSEGQALAGQRVLEPAAASDALLANGLRFVVLNLQTAPADLVDYVHRGLRVRLLAEDSGRQLYEVIGASTGG